MKIFAIALFVLMVAAQWFVPVSMVTEVENVKRTGTLFKFKTRPVDPTDPFRGSYITLYYEHDFYETRDSLWQTQNEIYTTVSPNVDGYAVISAVSITKPENGNYIKAKVSNYYDGRLWVDFPFTRFYLEESKAPEAERNYNNRNTEEKSNVYAEVYIKDGSSYLHDVKIEGKSIVDVVRESNNRTTVE
jgi:uncharacterized membrane-anchored protein